MSHDYTPATIFEIESSFAIQQGLSIDSLAAVHQWRRDLNAELPTDWHRLAAWVVAPVLTAFTQWLNAKIIQNKDANCFAVMRDGWLPGSLLQTLFHIPVKNLWFNRDLGMRAAFGCGDDEALLNWLVRTRIKPLTRKQAAQQLAGVPYGGPEPDKLLDLDEARLLIADWEKNGLLARIRADANKLADRLMQYWHKCAGSQPDNCYLIDFACAGNVQRSLQTIFAAHGENVTLEGLNFITSKGTQWAKQAGCELHGFLAEDGLPVWFADVYSRMPELIEIFTALPQGPLANYTDTGDPVWDNSLLETGQKKLVEELQVLIIKAAAFYRQFEITDDIARCIWGRLLLKPTPAEISLLSGWPLDAGLDGSLQREITGTGEDESLQWKKSQSA